MTENDIRWLQRFDNFGKAFNLLKQALEDKPDSLNQLEKEGVIQRFEYTFELAWKSLKDKMEHDGIVMDTISPKSVIKQAFASKYINEPEIWIKMIGDRNLMSHTYDVAIFEEIFLTIWKEYLPAIKELYSSLEKQK